MTELNGLAKASAKSGYYIFLGQTSSFIIAALTTIVIARVLGPEDYGIYNVSLVLPMLLIPLTDIGVSSSLIRFPSRFLSQDRKEKCACFIKIGITFKMASSLFVSLLLLVFADSISAVLGNPQLTTLVRLASLYLFGGSLFDTIVSAFVGLEESGKYSLMLNIQTLLKALFSIPLIVLGLGATGATLGIALSFVLASAIGAILLFLHPVFTTNDPEHKEDVRFFYGLRMITSYGLPLYLCTIIYSLIHRYQLLILSLFASYTQVGNYSTAITLSSFMTLLTQPMTMSLLPAFSRIADEKGQNTVERMFRLSARYTSLIVIPASLALALFSKEIVFILFGAQYELAPGYLALYILGYLCTGLGTVVLRSFLNGKGNTKMTLGIDSINLAVSLPLAPILTLLYGVYGLIVSTLVSHAISAISGLFLVRRTYGLSLDRTSSLKTFIASLSTVLLVYVLLALFPDPVHLHRLVFGGLLYVIAFLIVAPLLGAVSKADISNLAELTERLPAVHAVARRVLDFEKRILNVRSFLLDLA